MEEAQAKMANEVKRLKNAEALGRHKKASSPRKKRKKKKGEGNFNFQRAIAGEGGKGADASGDSRESRLASAEEMGL
jgi:hypothetical protein